MDRPYLDFEREQPTTATTTLVFGVSCCRNPRPTQVSPAQIRELVATDFSVDLDLKCRQRPYPDARAAACWLMREVLKLSQPAIGREMGFDHTSARSAAMRCDRLRKTDPQFRARTDELLRRVKGAA